MDPVRRKTGVNLEVSRFGEHGGDVKAAAGNGKMENPVPKDTTTGAASRIDIRQAWPRSPDDSRIR